jgi:hypothetical protein
MDRHSSLDSTLAALYRVISGPPGPRDWLREGELFAPHARITIVHGSADRLGVLECLSVDEYRASRDRFLRNHAFYETELDRRVDVHGDIAHAFSFFSYHRTPGDPAVGEGVNSIQLVYSARRWWIVSLMWESTEVAAELLTGVRPFPS